MGINLLLIYKTARKPHAFKLGDEWLGLYGYKLVIF